MSLLLGGFALALWAPGAAAQSGAAGPEPSATASADEAVAVLKTQGEAEAALFVLERYLSPDNDPRRIAALYGETVWYFDLGPQSRSQLMRDKIAYIQRWPVRRFVPDLSTLTVERFGGEVYDVRVEADFEVRNAERAIGGRSLIELTVERTDGGFLITEEGGRVLSDGG